MSKKPTNSPPRGAQSGALHTSSYTSSSASSSTSGLSHTPSSTKGSSPASSFITTTANASTAKSKSHSNSTSGTRQGPVMGVDHHFFGSIMESVDIRPTYTDLRLWRNLLDALNQPVKPQLNGKSTTLVWEERSSFHFVTSLFARIHTLPHIIAPSILIITASHDDARTIETLIMDSIDPSHRRRLRYRSSKRRRPRIEQSKLIGCDTISALAEEGKLRLTNTPLMKHIRKRMSDKHPLICIAQVDDLVACPSKVARIIKACTYVVAFEVLGFNSTSNSCAVVARHQCDPLFLGVETVEGFGTQLNLFRSEAH